MNARPRHLSFLLAIPFLALAACNGKHESPAVDAATPYLSLKVREGDRTALLQAASLLESGDHEQAKAGLARVEAPGTVRISVTSEGEGATEANKAVEEAVKIWNEALKGAVRFETGAGAGDADLAITFKPSVMEIHPNYSAPGCSNLTLSTDAMTGEKRKGQLEVSTMRPGTQNAHTAASLTHLVSKGIAGYMGLAKNPTAGGQLMGPDTHADTVPAKPSQEDVTTILQLLRYEKALSEAAESKTKPKIDYPVLTFETLEHDAGEVWRGEVVKVEFPYKNEGEAPLEIDVKPSCGCTVAKFDKVVQPGQSGKIEVNFATAGFSGKSSKHIDIFTNAVGNQGVKLDLKADIKPTFDVEPKGTQPVPLNDAGPTEYSFTVKPLEPEGAAVTEASGTGKYLTTSVAKEGELYRIKVSVSPDVPMGRTMQNLKIKTTSKREGDFTVPLALEKGICSIPSAAYFGFMRGNERFPLVRSIQLVRRTRPFNIKKVDTGDEKLAAEVQTRKPGSEYMVRLSYNGGWPSGQVSRVVVVHTDDPKQPKIEIPVQANVK